MSLEWVRNEDGVGGWVEAGGLLHKTIVLDDEAILALDTTPVELVEAVAGFIILPTLIVTQFSGTPYDENSAAIRFYVGPSWSASDWGEPIVNVVVVDGRIVVLDFTSAGTDGPSNAAASFGPCAIDSVGGPLTDGPGTLTVDTWYVLLPLVQ